MKQTLIFNRKEWLQMGWFSEEELNNADENGLIGQKFGVDCYLSRWV